MPLKILLLAARSVFVAFKIFTPESLDLLFCLLGENAEATDTEILLASFFPSPNLGRGLEESVMGEGC